MTELTRKSVEVPLPEPGHVSLLFHDPDLDARGVISVPLGVLPQVIQDLIVGGRDEFVLQSALDDLGMRDEWETTTDAEARFLMECVAVEEYSAKRRAEVAARRGAGDD